jgi:hypothetical protein
VKEVYEHYMQGLDHSLIRENLKLTPSQRMEKFERAMKLFFELQRAGQRMRANEAASQTQPESGADDS